MPPILPQIRSELDIYKIFKIAILYSIKLCLLQIVDILVLADIHKATDLKNQAIKFLLDHKEEVFAQSDWKHKLRNHPDILMEVLESTMDARDSPVPNKRRRRK